MAKESIQSPDLNAPRFRRTRYSVLNSAFCDQFRKDHPEYKGLTDGKIKEVIRTFNSSLWKFAIENRDGVELPEGLGFIFIGSCPPPKKRESLDVSLSLRMNARIRHRNLHTDGYMAKIFYTNYASKYKFMHREVWKFEGAREFRRAVSEIYPEKWMDYVKVDSFQHINKLFERARIKHVAKERGTTVDELYNEFEID